MGDGKNLDKYCTIFQFQKNEDTNLKDLAAEIYKKKYARDSHPEGKFIKERDRENKQEFRLDPRFCFPIQNPCEEVELPSLKWSDVRPTGITVKEHSLLLNEIKEINFYIQMLLQYINNPCLIQNSFDAQTKFVQTYLRWRQIDSEIKQNQPDKYVSTWLDKAHEILINIARKLGLE